LPGEINGTVGKLLRSVGRGRWAVSIDGKGRSTVVNDKNLERYVELAALKVQSFAKPKPYHIVGTWDDWESHEMEWDAGLSCFEFLVRLGNDCVESFKFLVDGEWDACVYPDTAGASCHSCHKVCGPDDGGVDSEWTIGTHRADLAKPGASYKVRIFVAADSRPQNVEWRLDPPDQANSVNTVPDHVMEDKEDVQAPSVVYLDPVRPEEDLDYRADLERDVEAVERAARLRLERRLRKAAEAEMQAITDGDEGKLRLTPDEEQAVIDSKLAENKRRYIAHCGTRKERQQLILNTIAPVTTKK